MPRIRLRSAFPARSGTAAAVVAILTSILLPGESLASIETDREVVRTYANFYIDQGEFSAAQKLLVEHLTLDARDTGAWNLLGIAYIEAGHSPQAAQAFFAAANSSSGGDKGIYLYNYADALIRSGDEARARTVLGLAARERSVREAAAEALRQLKSRAPLPSLEIDEESPSGNWSLGLSLGSGYDTNVLLVSTATIDSIDRSETASPYALFVAQGGWSKNFERSTLQAQAQSGLTYQINSLTRRFNTATAGLGLSWSQSRESTNSRFLHAAILTQDTSLLNTQGYRYFNGNVGLEWRGLYRWNSRIETDFSLPLLYQHFARSTGAEAEDDRTGVGVRPGITQRFRLWSSFVSFGARYERHLAHGTNFQAHTLALPAALSFALPFSLTASLGAEWSVVRYSESVLNRRDAILRTTGSLAHRFTPSTLGSLNYLFTADDSNVESATFDKHTLSLLLNYAI